MFAETLTILIINRFIDSIQKSRSTSCSNFIKDKRKLLLLKTSQLVQFKTAMSLLENVYLITVYSIILKFKEDYLVKSRCKYLKGL